MIYILYEKAVKKAVPNKSRELFFFKSDSEKFSDKRFILQPELLQRLQQLLLQP